MIKYAILRTKKLKTLGNIAGSSAHVTRSLKNETVNVDEARTTSNQVFLGTNPYLDTQALIPAKNRHNSVLAIETLLTATPEFFLNISD